MYECMNVNCMHVFCLRASMKIRLFLIELPSLNKEFIIIIIIIETNISFTRLNDKRSTTTRLFCAYIVYVNDVNFDQKI